MAIINKPSQPLIPPTDAEEVEEIATNVAEAAIAADDTHAPLVDDKVPAANLPSYVDDVLNFDSVDEFPEEGEEGKIYVANDTNLTYRWSGVAYIQVGGASLGEGDGITIENDLVSVDEEYLNEHLEFEAPIEDLATIRSGAAAGATATQPADVQSMIAAAIGNVLNEEF